ncbi:hypothetical protein [Lentzea aerocolonigenes]|uniref:hypothetical protein n=1 Tax=Lentzea aerocolonigenes TaxID=68170 RepID=UPI000AA3FADA|nr:hypothetical protein [Lentzea aerocolonigenes]
MRRDDTSNFGAFLLAASEVAKLRQVAAPRPVVRSAEQRTAGGAVGAEAARDCE